MANFDTRKIEVLFSLCLAKAKVGRVRNEYDKLSAAINDRSSFQEAKITQKYLDENIDKRLIKAHEEGKSTIGLKQDYVEGLVLYLNYENYREFEDIFNEALKLMLMVTSAQIKVFHNQERKGEVAQALTNLAYPDQAVGIEVILSEVPKELALLEKIKAHPLTILWVDQSWLIKQSLDLSDVHAKDPRLLIVFQDDKGKPVLTPITHRQLAIYFQILAIGLTEDRSSKTPDNDPNQTGQRPIIIKDSGAINLGNIGTIKAKYISSRDMTINIKKKK